MPPRSLPTTGIPRASASRTTIGWFSYQRDGTATTAAPSINRCTSALSTRPMEAHLPRRDRVRQRAKLRLIGPGPGDVQHAVSISPMARMAMSIPFSGESRPATSTPVPGAFLIGMSAVSMKCGTWTHAPRIDARRAHSTLEEPARADEDAAPASTRE